MKVLSLFSGVGGFDLGLENAGMETVFQCEWDKHATTVLERHWPDVPRWGDITTLTGRHILDHAPVIDVVAWGSPCQDLSVAGKRAGLSGERSGLFHEGIRIIKELRKETNNAYPRISIWENVYGALNSNKGADFGLVLDEMAEAGAMVIEWRVLDAQYFGVPQRRRRVFVVAVFDPRIAANCPDPLLPLRQGVRWNPATSRTTRKESAGTVEQSPESGGGTDRTYRRVTGALLGRDSFGPNHEGARDGKLILETTTEETEQSLASGRGIANTIAAELYHHASVTNQDANNGHLIIGTASVPEWWSGGQIADTITTKSDDQRMPDKNRLQVVIGTLAARDYKGVGNQYVDEGKLVVEPFVKAKRAQSTTDDETWVEGDINPTINQFDQGDVRATTAIVTPSHPIANTLRVGSGVGERGDGTDNLVTAIVMRQREGKPGGGKGPLLSEDKSLTLAAAGNDQTLFVEAIPIQDGREIEKNQNGLGIAESGAPAYTLDQTGAQAVAYSFDSLASNSMKSSNPHSGVNEVDVAKTLDTARPDPSCNQGGIAIVQPIGIQGNVIGRQDHNGPAGKGHTDEGDPMFTLNTTDRHAVATTEPTVFQPGTMTRLGGGVWEGTVPTLRAEVKRGDNEPHIMTEPTMSVRRLTPLECERLMGWPDNWTAGQADTHRYKQCGNGVASPVAQWIGEQILNIPQ